MLAFIFYRDSKIGKIALFTNFESKYLSHYNIHNIYQIFKNYILPVASDDVYNYLVPAAYSFCAIRV